MRIRDVPIVRAVIEAGPNDRFFDALLLCGPVVVAFLAVVGRSALTTGVVVLYLLTFVGYVLYRGASRDWP